MAESSNPKVEAEATKGEDKELDELLNSALEDLIKPPTKSDPTDSAVTTKPDEIKNLGANHESTMEALFSQMMGASQAGDNTTQDELNASVQKLSDIKNLAANYESSMEALLGQLMGASQPSDNTTPITLPNQDEINASIQKLAEATTQILSKSQPSTNNDEITATIFETLKSLSTGAQNAQNMDLNDEAFASMFSNLGLDGSTASLPGMGGTGAPGDGFIIQDMMQWLISKDVLYPSLKEVTDKYPQWLEENKSTLDEATFERYTKQNALMNSVCTELESEVEGDTPEMKKERTNRVLNLMLQLEYLGEPPTDLVKANQLENTQMALSAAAQNGACCLQ